MILPPVAAPLVSVVIPTHNRAHVVARAIRSALAQTVSDLEVLVVDDGSTDNTSEVVKAFGDARLRFLALTRNAGVSCARNRGIQAARGGLVAFLDSDDEWLPGKLERQLARLGDDPRASVVYCGWSRADEPTGHDRPSPGAVYYEGDVLQPLVDGWTPGTSSFVVRRSTLLAIGGFDEELRAWTDYDLWLRLAGAGHHFLAVRERLRIKHDFVGPQLTTDPVARLRAFQRLEQKWGGVIRSLRGAQGFHRWRAWGYASVQYAWLRRMEAAAIRGNRVEVWRCYLGMWRDVRWSRRGLGRALTLALLGAGAYTSLRCRYDALDGFIRDWARRAAR